MPDKNKKETCEIKEESMSNRRFLALALVLVGLLLVTAISPAGAQTADQREGRAATAPQALATTPSELTIPTDGVWNFFTWTGAPGVFATPSFEFTGPAVIDVTDVQRDGDRFEVYDNGVLVGTTSAPTNTGTNLPEQGIPSPSQVECDAGFAAAGWSSATFDIFGAGAHSITIKNIAIPTNPTPFSAGGGCIRANPVPAPDLVVSSLTHTPANPTTNDDIEFVATVKNVGGVAAGSSTLMFKIGGETPGIANTLFEVDALASGESFAVTRTLATLDAQSYTNTATADWDNDVAEFDEANNTTTDSYTVTEATPPVAITYSILSLPVDESSAPQGELFNGDASGNPTGPALGVGDTIDDPTKLVYVPPATFEGTVTFDYRCTNNTIPAPNTDDATVTIVVTSAGSGVTLTVNFLGGGSGDVTLDVGGTIVQVCSSSCTQSLGAGDVVKLQARPIDLFNFGGWGGDCSGTSQIFTLTMPASGSKTCTATFNP